MHNIQFHNIKSHTISTRMPQAYNVPSKANYAQVFDMRQQWSNGTAVTYTNQTVLRDLVKGWLLITVKHAHNLPKADFLTRSSDPYIVVKAAQNYGRTPTVPTNLNPEWGTSMCFFLRDPSATTVTVECYDEDKGHKVCGLCLFVFFGGVNGVEYVCYWDIGTH